MTTPAMSELDLGRLCEKVEQLSREVRENNNRIDCLERQLVKTKGFGVGLAVGLIGLSSGIASAITKLMN
tara:strand:- start:18 stop:227 length:210 start_codon:yes stop_codon:yes gene_type:complete